MYLEVLKSKQKEVFKGLKYFSEFYLVGGTALALQIGHRFSEDFDFFIDQDLSKNLIRKIRRVFKKSEIKISLRGSEQINVSVDTVKMNFVKYKYPLIFKLSKFNGFKIASISEIALMKAITLGGRASVKDYVDLYFILKERLISLNSIIKNCQKKYEGEFNDRLFLEQLVYFEDVQEVKIEFLKEKVTKKQMQKFFEQEIGKLKI